MVWGFRKIIRRLQFFFLFLIRLVAAEPGLAAVVQIGGGVPHRPHRLLPFVPQMLGPFFNDPL